MTTELWRQSAVDLAAAIRGKEVSATEVLEAHLSRIAATNPTISPCICVDLCNYIRVAYRRQCRLCRAG